MPIVSRVCPAISLSPLRRLLPHHSVLRCIPQQLRTMAGRHPDFKTVEGSRPPFDTSNGGFKVTRTVAPSWTPGGGATSSDWKEHKTVEIDPYGPGRASGDNYKLLISGIVPRPIGFLSTVSADGNSTNLAPMSYTNVVSHDPPIFTIGLSGGKGAPKDTTRNLLESGECTINIISEWFVEAANACSINAPFGTSEWPISGLTPAPSKLVKSARVAESAFAIEAKLIAHHEWESPSTGKKTGVLAILQGVYFHVRDDALNEAKNMIDPAVLRPVSRLGGITYGRTTEGFEIPRPDFEKTLQDDPKLREIVEKYRGGKEAKNTSKD